MHVQDISECLYFNEGFLHHFNYENYEKRMLIYPVYNTSNEIHVHLVTLLYNSVRKYCMIFKMKDYKYVIHSNNKLYLGNNVCS